jgi:DNA-binding winged helix-turn-helix (wHTH) protein
MVLDQLLDSVSIGSLASACHVWRGLLQGRRPDSRKIVVANSELYLEGSVKCVGVSPDEKRLLSFLLEHCDTVFTPETILSQVWGPSRVNDRPFLTATVASLNCALHRSGLSKGMIENFYDVGYRLRPHDETDGAKVEAPV